MQEGDEWWGEFREWSCLLEIIFQNDRQLLINTAGSTLGGKEIVFLDKLDDVRTCKKCFLFVFKINLGSKSRSYTQKYSGHLKAVALLVCPD